MKKISSMLSVLTCVFLFAQSTPLVINNYSSYDTEGRLATLAPAGTTPSFQMTAAHNLPTNSGFVIPSGGSTKYITFDTAGNAAYPILNWHVSDFNNQNNNGSYAYNDPLITTINALNEWGGYYFFLRDPATGNILDSHQIGNPALNPSYITWSAGPNTTAEWYTITTSTGAVTFLEIYDL